MTLPRTVPAPRAPVYAVAPRGSSEAELRCNGTYDHGRDCRRLLIRIYVGTVGRMQLYCTRCHQHHRVLIDFPTSTGARVGPE